MAPVELYVDGPERALDEAAVRDLPWKGVVALDQVLRHSLPAYGGDTWSQALSELCLSPGELELVERLAAELAVRLAADPAATFDFPVVLQFTDPSDWDAQDEATYGPRPTLPTVRNGMHRLAAYVLAGASHVLVALRPSPEVPDWGDPSDPPLVLVRARLHVVDSDVLEFSTEWLRSFRLADDVWVETDGTNVDGDVCEWLFHCPHDQKDALAGALVRRAAEHGAMLDVVEATATTWDQVLE